MTCSKANCEKQVHENINGITFDTCTKHTLSKLSDLRDNNEEIYKRMGEL